jgi:neutral ceramidase
MLSYMLDMKDADWQQVREYQLWLNARMIELIDAAVADLKPARLSTGSGRTTFAANRRDPKGLGPYDHQVPVLRIESPDGRQLRGLVFGYACHNTTLGFYNWCGDYAGFAQLYLEDRHPDCVAMFFTGGGADQNPLPRRTIELAEKYGRMLATAVDDVLDDNDLKPVTGQLKTAFRDIDLKFATLPSKQELEDVQKTGSRFLKARATNLLKQWDEHGHLLETYPYPVQVWQLGNGLSWVALGGELVVEYQLRLKHELGDNRTWVTGYANDVMAYIPSERVLEEGGYEGDSSMIYYQMPSKWKAGLEQQIVDTVHELNRATRR